LIVEVVAVAVGLLVGHHLDDLQHAVVALDVGQRDLLRIVAALLVGDAVHEHARSAGHVVEVLRVEEAVLPVLVEGDAIVPRVVDELVPGHDDLLARLEGRHCRSARIRRTRPAGALLLHVGPRRRRSQGDVGTDLAGAQGQRGEHEDRGR
jgi:hypothetical protein